MKILTRFLRKSAARGVVVSLTANKLDAPITHLNGDVSFRLLGDFTSLVRTVVLLGATVCIAIDKYTHPQYKCFRLGGALFKLEMYVDLFIT